jgi:arabinogalactan endo-1,4-beta-galactosidase
MIVEVAYPFTFDYADNLNNFIGNQSQILTEFAANPQGQKDFLIKINSIIKNIPNNKGIGWIYWAPDWVAFDGNVATSTQGSSWENQCLFDLSHKALPAFDAFNP